MWWEIAKIIILAFVAGWGIFRWTKDKAFKVEMQKRDDKLSREIEELKNEYMKKQTIHKVQFETEFKIYKDLWTIILKISDATTSLDTYISKAQDSSQDNKLCLKKLREAMDLIREAHNLIFLNKPFYSKLIYNLCNELTDNYVKQVRYLTDIFNKGKFADKIAIVLLSNLINPIITKIDKAIQKQIGFIKEAEIVE